MRRPHSFCLPCGYSQPVKEELERSEVRTVCTVCGAVLAVVLFRTVQAAPVARVQVPVSPERARFLFSQLHHAVESA